MTPLTGWENFYVIVGSSAGALIGLQFVVIALIANLPRTATEGDASNAFATPNVVHFGTVLLISGLLTAPWHSMRTVTLLLVMLGLSGAAYSLIVARRMRVQTLYQPVLEDWFFHAMLPFFAYAVLAASAYEARAHVYGPTFGIAAAVMLLLFIGIHNAWDAVTYHVFVVRSKRPHSESGSLGQTSSNEPRSS